MKRRLLKIAVALAAVFLASAMLPRSADQVSVLEAIPQRGSVVLRTHRIEFGWPLAAARHSRFQWSIQSGGTTRAPTDAELALAVEAMSHISASRCGEYAATFDGRAVAAELAQATRDPRRGVLFVSVTRLATNLAAWAWFIAAAHFWRRWRKDVLRQSRQREGRCAECGYDLRGSIGSLVCPECGAEIQPGR